MRHVRELPLKTVGIATRHREGVMNWSNLIEYMSSQNISTLDYYNPKDVAVNETELKII